MALAVLGSAVICTSSPRSRKAPIAWARYGSTAPWNVVKRTGPLAGRLHADVESKIPVRKTRLHASEARSVNIIEAKLEV
jgi:hypothetical protein